MKKFKITLPIMFFLCLFVSAFSFTPAYSESTPVPTVPTIVSYSYNQMIVGQPAEVFVRLFNPEERICSVDTTLAFPKDLMEVQSFNTNYTNSTSNYSNDDGTINFKNVFSVCITDVMTDLFSVTFTMKQAGQGTIHVTKSIITGGSDGVTVFSNGVNSAVYSDVPVDIASAEEGQPGNPNNSPDNSPDNSLPGFPANIPLYSSKTTTDSTAKSGTASSTKSAGASTKTPGLTENSSFKTPTLTKLEFGPNATLDKPNKRTQGAIFTGTAEPNSKIDILIQSQNEIYTDTTSGADGIWTKTIEGWIEDGSHTVTIWSEKNNQVSPEFSSNFVISSYAKDQIAIGDTYPELNINQTSDTGTKTDLISKISALVKNKFFWICVGVALVLAVLIIVLIVKSRRKKNGFGDSMISGGMGEQ